jgi:hypothetical protein
MLQKCVAELEEENSWLKATIMKLQRSVDSSIETIATRQWFLAAGIEDLEFELTKAHASIAEDIPTLEARIKCVEAHSVDVAIDGENCFCDFEK